MYGFTLLYVFITVVKLPPFKSILKTRILTAPVGDVEEHCDEYVCLSVREDISEITSAIFTKFFMHVACVRGSVLLWHVYDRPHRLSPGRGFLPHWKCIIGWERGDGSAQWGWSMLSMIALLFFNLVNLVSQTLHLTASFPGQLGKPASKRLNQFGF